MKELHGVDMIQSTNPINHGFSYRGGGVGSLPTPSAASGGIHRGVTRNNGGSNDSGANSHWKSGFGVPGNNLPTTTTRTITSATTAAARSPTSLTPRGVSAFSTPRRAALLAAAIATPSSSSSSSSWSSTPSSSPLASPASASPSASYSSNPEQHVRPLHQEQQKQDKEHQSQRNGYPTRRTAAATTIAPPIQQPTTVKVPVSSSTSAKKIASMVARNRGLTAALSSSKTVPWKPTELSSSHADFTPEEYYAYTASVTRGSTNTSSITHTATSAVGPAVSSTTSSTTAATTTRKTRNKAALDDHVKVIATPSAAVGSSNDSQAGSCSTTGEELFAHRLFSRASKFQHARQRQQQQHQQAPKEPPATASQMGPNQPELVSTVHGNNCSSSKEPDGQGATDVMTHSMTMQEAASQSTLPTAKCRRVSPLTQRLASANTTKKNFEVSSGMARLPKPSRSASVPSATAAESATVSPSSEPPPPTIVNTSNRHPRAVAAAAAVVATTTTTAADNAHLATQASIPHENSAEWQPPHGPQQPTSWNQPKVSQTSSNDHTQDNSSNHHHHVHRSRPLSQSQYPLWHQQRSASPGSAPQKWQQQQPGQPSGQPSTVTLRTANRKSGSPLLVIDGSSMDFGPQSSGGTQSMAASYPNRSTLGHSSPAAKANSYDYPVADQAPDLVDTSMGSSGSQPADDGNESHNSEFDRQFHDEGELDLVELMNEIRNPQGKASQGHQQQEQDHSREETKEDKRGSNAGRDPPEETNMPNNTASALSLQSTFSFDTVGRPIPAPLVTTLQHGASSADVKKPIPKPTPSVLRPGPIHATGIAPVGSSIALSSQGSMISRTRSTSGFPSHPDASSRSVLAHAAEMASSSAHTPMMRMRDSKVQKEAACSSVNGAEKTSSSPQSHTSSTAAGTRPKTEEEIKAEMQRKWKKKLKQAEKRREEERKALDGTGGTHRQRGRQRRRVPRSSSNEDDGNDNGDKEEDYDSSKQSKKTISSRRSRHTATSSHRRRHRRRPRTKINPSPRRMDDMRLPLPPIPNIFCQDGLSYWIEKLADTRCGQLADTFANFGEDDDDDDSTDSGDDIVEEETEGNLGNSKTMDEDTTKDETADTTNASPNAKSSTQASPSGSGASPPPPANTAAVLDEEDHFVHVFSQAILWGVAKKGLTLLQHKENQSEGLSKPSKIILFIKPSTPKIAGSSYVGPYLHWQKQSDGVVVGDLDLFDVKAVERPSALQLNQYPLAVPGRCIYIRMVDGSEIVFETSSEDSALRLVDGLRRFVARLAFCLVQGNVDAYCELIFDAPSLLHHEGDHTATTTHDNSLGQSNRAVAAAAAAGEKLVPQRLNKRVSADTLNDMTALLVEKLGGP